MGLGDFLNDVFGSENEFQAKEAQVDNNAFEYGGYAGGAQAAQNMYGAQGDQHRAQAGEYRNQNRDLFNRGSNSMNLAGQARQDQMGIASAMRARAMGQVPSIAQMQADRQMGQVAAEQASAAAGARGPAAMALAQQNAAGNTSNAQSNISGQAQINAANERMQAEQAAMGAFSGIRGQDYQGAQTAYGAAANAANAQAQQGQLAQGYSQLQKSVGDSQLAAQQNKEQLKSANANNAQGINAGVAGQNAGAGQAMGGAALGGTFGAASSAIGAAAKARGGPVEDKKPYLVGEEGPELVIPKRDGFVIPADQTRTLLAAMGRGDLQDKDSAVISARAGGGDVRGCRADGGPMEASGPADFVPAMSTWGAQPANAAAQRQEYEAKQQQAANIRAVLAQQAQYRDPWQREADRVHALRSVNPDLVDEKDVAAERRAKSNEKFAKRRAGETEQATEKKPDEPKQAPADKAKEAPKSAAGAAAAGFGTGFKEGLQATPSTYRPAAQMIAPQFIGLPTRAEGGPIEAGGAGLSPSLLAALRMPAGKFSPEGSYTATVPMQNVPGYELHQSREGKAGYKPVQDQERPPKDRGEGDSGGDAGVTKSASSLSGAMKRKQTPDEASRELDRLLANQRAQLAAGPSVQATKLPPGWLDAYMAGNARAMGGPVDGGGSNPYGSLAAAIGGMFRGGGSSGGAAEASPYVLTSGGGMDVMGTLKKNNEPIQQMMARPGSKGGY